MKQYSILVIIKEMQMCTTIEYFETIIKIALKKIGNIKCRKDTEQLKLSRFAGLNAKLYWLFKKPIGSLLYVKYTFII